MDDLICEIRSLLELGYEGGYWDFKSDYPDKNKKEDQPIGMLPVDSIFTPVTRVNFLVENTRVGQITDYHMHGK